MIEYRRKGESAWRRGLDLLRLQREETFLRGALDYTAPNMFAGSLFDLRGGFRDYEVRLTLTRSGRRRPGQCNAHARKLLVARTRAEPKPATGGKVYHVYPPGYTGPKQQPAFAGLLEAYYMAALGGDWSRASPPRVQGRRHHPGARGSLPLEARSLFARDQFALHHLLLDAMGWHLLPDAGRDRRQARSRSSRPAMAR